MKKVLIIIGSVVFTLALGLGLYWFLAMGTLTISANVAGAEILVDGQKIGQGTVAKQIKRDKYTFLVKKSQYVTYEQSFQIYGWQKKSFSVKLEKLPTPVVIKKTVSNFLRDKDMQNLLLAQKDGKEFVRFNPLNSKEELLSRVDFGLAIKTKWSPNNFLAYIWRADASSGLVDLKRYDLLNQEFLPGKKGILDLAWNTEGTEVVYIYKPGDGEYSLVKSLPTGENMERLVFHLDKEGIKDPKLEWTYDGKDLLLTDENIYVYNFYSHKLNKITQGNGIILAKLSFNGKYIVYSSNKGTYLSKLDGTNVKKLGETLESFEWLPDGKEIIGFSKGEFMKINVQTGTQTNYGYNGARMKNIAGLTMLKGSDTIYYLVKNDLMKLNLQPKVTEMP